MSISRDGTLVFGLQLREQARRLPVTDAEVPLQQRRGGGTLPLHERCCPPPQRGLSRSFR